MNEDFAFMTHHYPTFQFFSFFLNLYNHQSISNLVLYISRILIFQNKSLNEFGFGFNFYSLCIIQTFFLLVTNIIPQIKCDHLYQLHAYMKYIYT